MTRFFKPNSILKVAVLTAACAAMVAPATASAGYQSLLLDACGADGTVNGSYTQREFREALANIPADADQYSDCRAILTEAQLAAAAGGSGASSDSISSSTSAAASQPTDGTDGSSESAADKETTDSGVSDAVATGGDAVTVGAAVVNPDSLGAGRSASATISSLPTALIVALALIGAGALAALLFIIIPRVRAYYAS
ncbi:MAG: hypothetical protein F2813_01610 [Actinobacteria bacterium]|uniref:Unannotated protein n=1 Tax=freshwater metagenome TaxID=449393 RepID=A0A6J5ZBW8_9ZZZZ|nr:hypothetical protein [Actinomycetota bacterium]